MNAIPQARKIAITLAITPATFRDGALYPRAEAIKDQNRQQFSLEAFQGYSERHSNGWTRAERPSSICGCIMFFIIEDIRVGRCVIQKIEATTCVASVEEGVKVEIIKHVTVLLRSPMISPTG